MSAEEFIAEMTEAEGRKDRWVWIDRRAIDGTVKAVTGPYAGQTFESDEAR